jgi:uncharacterized membrane protein YGL010W
VRLRDWPALSAEYAADHATRGNRVCHAFGVPSIAYAVVALSRVGPGVGVPTAALLLPLYFSWDRRIGVLMTLFVAGSTAAAALLPAWSPYAALAAGIVFQAAGHSVFEGRRPAFTRDLLHLLVGPAWVAAELTGLRPGS